MNRGRLLSRDQDNASSHSAKKFQSRPSTHHVAGLPR
jgi:hypothetical protein